MLKLQFKDQRKPAIWLVEQRYAIGKAAQNNIVLGDEGVDDFHAELRIEGDQVFITPTAANRETSVNGKRVQRRTELRPGDVIAIHKVELQLVDPKAEAHVVPEGATAISPALANIPIAGAGRPQESGWSLKAKTGSIVGKVFAIPPAGKVVIGRANNCDVQLPANQVSRQHAEVMLVAGKLMVRDLNSANGTFINRKKVSEGELKPGDDVRFDTFSFEVIGPAPAAAPAASAPAAKAAPADKPGATGVRPRIEEAPRPAPVKASASTTVNPRASDTGTGKAKKGGTDTGSLLIGGILLVGVAVAAWFVLMR